MIVLGVTVTGLKESYEVGDRLMLNCSTDLLNARMAWQSENMLTLEQTISKSYVIFSENVIIEMDQQVLICRSDSPFGEQTTKVTISVMPESQVTTSVMTESPRDLLGPIVGGVLGGVFLIFLIVIIIIISLICCFCCQPK